MFNYLQDRSGAAVLLFCALLFAMSIASPICSPVDPGSGLFVMMKERALKRGKAHGS